MLNRSTLSPPKAVNYFKHSGARIVSLSFFFGKFRPSLVLFIHVLIFIVVQFAYASKDDVEEIESFPKTGETYADEFHKKISDLVLDGATWIDSLSGWMDYLSNHKGTSDKYESIYEEKNTSYMKVRVATPIEDREGFSSTQRVYLKLTLPKFKNRLQLIFNEDPDEDGVIGNIKKEKDADKTKKSNKEGIFKFLKSMDDAMISNKIQIRGGVRWRDRSPVLYMGPRYKGIFSIKSLQFRFSQRFRWFTDQGWDSKTSLDIEKPINEKLFPQFTPSITWYEDESGFEYSLGARLFQIITPYRSLEYKWTNYFISQSADYLDEVEFKIRYRQRIWRDWLTIEVSPQLVFSKERDFDCTPGILVGLEGLFGAI